MAVAPGAPSSFVTSSAVQVAFPVPTPPPNMGGTFYHNHGHFHARGSVLVNYNNTSFTITERMDWVFLGLGYNQIVKNDDYFQIQAAAHISVPPRTSGSLTVSFDADFIHGSTPFGKNPEADLNCGPGEFWVGLLGGALSWSTDSGSLLQVTSIVATYDNVEFDYDVIADTISICGGTGLCPRCSGTGDVPTGAPLGFTALCGTKMTGAQPPVGWTVYGTGLVPDPHASILGNENEGWRVNFSNCSILVEAPCLDYPPELKGQIAAYCTVVVNVGGVGWIAQFHLIYDVPCHIVIPLDGATGSCWNLQDKRGFYHASGNVVSGSSTNAVYWRSDSPVPKPWAVKAVTIAMDASEPRVEIDHRGIYYAIFSKSSGVLVRRSMDDGTTWGNEILAIGGGKHPTIAVGTEGTVILAAYVGPLGGPGTISATLQSSGDAAASAQFTFKDQAGANLSVADDTFHIQQGREGPGRWLLHVLINGEGSSSHWWSTDNCASWKKVS